MAGSISTRAAETGEGSGASERPTVDDAACAHWSESIHSDPEEPRSCHELKSYCFGRTMGRFRCSRGSTSCPRRRRISAA